MTESQNSDLHGILKCPNSIFHSQICGSLKNQDLSIIVTLKTNCQVVLNRAEQVWSSSKFLSSDVFTVLLV